MPISELVKEWTDITASDINRYEADDKRSEAKQERQGNLTVNMSVGSRAYVTDMPVDTQTSDSKIPFHLHVQDQSTGRVLWDMSWTWSGD